MDRLEQDLRYFSRELETENDPFRRHLIQQRIVVTQRAILALMVEEREEINRQNANMERALEIIRKREEDKKKWIFFIKMVFDFNKEIFEHPVLLFWS